MIEHKLSLRVNISYPNEYDSVIGRVYLSTRASVSQLDCEWASVVLCLHDRKGTAPSQVRCPRYLLIYCLFRSSGNRDNLLYSDIYYWETDVPIMNEIGTRSLQFTGLPYCVPGVHLPARERTTLLASALNWSSTSSWALILS